MDINCVNMKACSRPFTSKLESTAVLTAYRLEYVGVCLSVLMVVLLFYHFRTLFRFTDQASMQSVSSNSCAAPCLRKFHVRIYVCLLHVKILIDSLENTEKPLCLY